MASKINISEFSIKVKLDSGTASRGLKNLQSNLKKLQTQMQKTFANQNAKLQSFKARTAAVGKMAQQQKKFNNELKTSNQGAVGLVKSFRTIKGLLAAGLGFFVVKSLISNIYQTLQGIVSLGAKVQQGMLTMDAAIGASDIGAALGPESLRQLQEQQRNFAENLASTYGLNLANTMSNYAKFFAASSNYIGVQGSSDLFKSLTELGVVYGLSSEKMDRAMTAFTQMASKNQVMAEELKQQLGDVLPGSMEIFARAMTKMGKFGIVTVEKLYDMMAKGKIVASEVLPFVTQEMERMAKGGLAAALELVSVRIGRFQTSLSIFSTGALNQFDQTLGRIFDRLTEIFKGKGFQAATGQWINTFLEGALDLLNDLTKGFDRFEEKFAKAKYKEDQFAVIETFWDTVLFDPLKEVWGKIKTWLNDKVEGTLNPIIVRLATAFADALVSGLTRALSPWSWLSDNAQSRVFDFFDYMKDDHGISDMLRNPQSSVGTTIINVGDINATATSNDPMRAKEDATDMGREMLSSVYDLIPTGLSTGQVG